MMTVKGRLTASLMRKQTLWRFGDSGGEPVLLPVRSRKVHGLVGLLVCVQVRLAGGRRVWSIMSNVHSTDQLQNEHFLTPTFLVGGKFFPLARYHDPLYGRFGPRQFAKFLGMRFRDVFPISYSLRDFLVAPTAVASGSISGLPPRRRLSEAALVRLAMKD